MKPPPVPQKSLKLSSYRVRVFAASHPEKPVDPAARRQFDEFVDRSEALRELYGNTTAFSCRHQRTRGQHPNVVRGHGAAKFPWRFLVRVLIGVVRSESPEPGPNVRKLGPFLFVEGRNSAALPCGAHGGWSNESALLG